MTWEKLKGNYKIFEEAGFANVNRKIYKKLRTLVKDMKAIKLSL